MVSIEQIIAKAESYLGTLNRARVQHAFEFARDAHEGQKRFSGEPYIIHPIGVTWMLLDFHPDEDSIIAALLHDVAEDTTKTLDDIEKAFGPDVRGLCWGMQKLSKVRSKLNDPQIENLRKLFLAMAKDFRVILIKLCDRLHNMSTFEFVRPEKRTRIAQETLNIYAPIAARLGIYRLKSQLEDLCFQYLRPTEFKDIQEQLAKTVKWREKYIDNAKQILIETLSREGMKCEVDGRVKSIYSIYRKLQKKGKHSIDDVFDVFAMRIILPDIYKYGKEYTGHIYTALGILHNNFTPLANRFKDYVAVPKVNGYRSLHTTVMGLGPKVHTQPTEVQIRTQSMHQGAEFGIAAHWLYEEGLDLGLNSAIANSAAPVLAQHKEWISGLKKIESEIQSNQELLENLQVDVFQDRIFVLTPRGDVKDLPASATPIDFAYAVHTEIGNRCIGVRVNGTVVPVDYALKSGEVVEIITRKNARPSQYWLSFVKTNHARNRIRAWFRDLDEGRHLREGKELLNERLKQLGKPLLGDSLSILKNYDEKSLTTREREELIIEIGKGVLTPSTVLKKIFTLEELLASKGEQSRSFEAIINRTAPAPREAPRLSIGGDETVPYHFVKCCNAAQDDELIGYITRGRGVSVHQKKCLVIKNTEPSRVVQVGLSKAALPAVKCYPVHVRVSAVDRLGLIRDISNIIAESGINIVHISQKITPDGAVDVDFILEIGQFDQLERVLFNLEKIPNVRRAAKVS